MQNFEWEYQNQSKIFQRYQNKILAFFSNPVVGILGSLASIISLVLAIVFYFQGLAYRDFVYTIYPVRTVLAQGGN